MNENFELESKVFFSFIEKPYLPYFRHPYAPFQVVEWFWNQSSSRNRTKIKQHSTDFYLIQIWTLFKMVHTYCENSRSRSYEYDVVTIFVGNLMLCVLIGIDLYLVQIEYESFHAKSDKKITHVDDLSQNFVKYSSMATIKCVLLKNLKQIVHEMISVTKRNRENFLAYIFMINFFCNDYIN